MECCIRPWRREDAPSLAQFANNPNIAANLRDGFPYPYSLKDAKAFIQACLRGGEEAQLMRAIEINGFAAGSISVVVQQDIYRKTAEIGYFLGQPYWGRGIMAQAVQEISYLAFVRFDIVRIFAEVYASNTASRHVLEKAGFVYEGTLRKSVYKNGQILDSCMYALIR